LSTSRTPEDLQALVVDLEQSRAHNARLQSDVETLARAMSVLALAPNATELLQDLLGIVRELVDAEEVALLFHAGHYISDGETPCEASTSSTLTTMPWPQEVHRLRAKSEAGLLYFDLSHAEFWADFAARTGMRSALMLAAPSFEDGRMPLVVGLHRDVGRFRAEHVERLRMVLPAVQQALVRRDHERLQKKQATLQAMHRESAWRLARVERALSAVGAGVATVMHNLTVGEASGRFAAMADEFGGVEKWGNLLIENFAEELWQPFDESSSKLMFFRDSRGEDRCFEVHMVDGEDACLLLVKDITEDRNAEQAYWASESIKDAILRSSLDGIISMDENGRILDFNPAATRMFGVDRAATIGKQMAELLIPEHLRAAHHRAVTQFLLTRESRLEGRRVEVPALRADGTTFPAEVAVSHTDVGDNTIFTAYIRDISERRHSDAALEQARDKALAADQAKSNLLATISHEVRTPLNAALGLTELALDTPLPQETRSLLTTAVQNARSLSSLLDELLNYARGEANDLSLQTLRFDLSALLAEVAQSFALAAEAKGIELRLHLEPRLPRDVRGDEGRLRQILSNLVSNAVKFTPQSTPGQPPERVVIEANFSASVDGERRLRIAVSDTGPGIDVEHSSSVFQRFERGSQRHIEGTGLGLSISKALAERMGGHLVLDENTTAGSCFVLEIPLLVRTVGGGGGLQHQVVFYSDDDEDRAYWTAQLEAAQTSVRQVASLESLQDANERYVLLAQRHAPDVDPQLVGKKGVRLLPLGAAGKVPDDGFAHLPLWTSPAVLLHTLQDPVRKEVQERSLSLGMRVLVVDDLDSNRRVLARYLMNLGCDVEEANGGTEAINKTAQERFDLVFMDIHMPDVDGIDATRAIRDRERDRRDDTERVPIVAVTAHAIEEMRDEAMAAGMDDFMTKPVSKEKLGELLADVMPQRGMRAMLPRVLIVDDAPDQRLVLSRFLEGHYAVDVAVDLQQAQEAVLRRRPDVLLVDKEVGGTDGLDWLRQLQQQKALPDHVVLVTGHRREDVLSEATAVGCAQVMQKPVHREQLMHTLRQLLRPASMGRTSPSSSAEVTSWEGVPDTDSDLASATTSVSGEDWLPTPSTFALPPPTTAPPVDVDTVEVDPDIADLVPNFLQQRKADAETLAVLLDDQQFDKVRRIGHNIKGSARSYGFALLGDLGEALESAAAQQHEDACREGAADILDHLSRVAYVARTETPTSSKVTQPLSLDDVNKALE